MKELCKCTSCESEVERDISSDVSSVYQWCNICQKWTHWRRTDEPPKKAVSMGMSANISMQMEDHDKDDPRLIEELSKGVFGKHIAAATGLPEAILTNSLPATETFRAGEISEITFKLVSLYDNGHALFKTDAVFSSFINAMVHDENVRQIFKLLIPKEKMLPPILTFKKKGRIGVPLLPDFKKIAEEKGRFLDAEIGSLKVMKALRDLADNVEIPEEGDE